MCIQSVTLTLTFFDLSKRSRKTLIFQLQTLDGCHFVWTRSQLCVTNSTTDVSVRLSVRPSVCLSVCHFTGATLCGPDLRNFLPFTLNNDFYRQLRCRRCASNLLYWPWHFFDLFKRSWKTLIFQLQTLDGATLCEPDLRNCLPFTLDNDLYRPLRCRRCASNLLYWPWHFFYLSKNFDFSTSWLWTETTLCGPDLKNCFSFTLDNDLYRQLRCCRCASNLLFWPFQKVTKNIYFST